MEVNGCVQTTNLSHLKYVLPECYFFQVNFTGVYLPQDMNSNLINCICRM